MDIKTNISLSPPLLSVSRSPRSLHLQQTTSHLPTPQRRPRDPFRRPHRPRATRLPVRRCLWRHVHRQHHGDRHRSHGPLAAGLLLLPGDIPRKGPRVRACRGRHSYHHGEGYSSKRLAVRLDLPSPVCLYLIIFFNLFFFCANIFPSPPQKAPEQLSKTPSSSQWS